ncbi:alkaline phosphatase family protein [Hyphococcus flavus]|uniref:Alkaline phosphatase family protein n=1 Tax=Hyphococcus flavus TaxID=1866326 RepID=A0AAE9ZK35_9PROT|nr:alkaline phosphatase family protein [Hyphococcus flavus]WDI32085.1 alkaline phosphatase family protein [Hyphococcus flavus]
MTAKTLVFGFDGADHAYIDAMIADGELPVFARLKASSRVFNFENDAAMGAAQFWNSASIGAGPAHHGHYFYMQFKPDTYDIVPNHDSSIPEITPFWNTLDDEGFSVGVIDWHRLQPKPLKNGFLIDNWTGHDPLTDTVFLPETLKEETIRFFNGDSAAGGFASKPRVTAEDQNEYLSNLFQRIEAKTKFCEEKLAQKEWDLFMTCYAEAHDVGHYFYHLDDPNHPRYDAQLAKDVKEPLRECYRRLDEAVGRVIEAAGEGAKVFIYGGPGMEMLVSANSATEEMIRRIDLGVGAPKSGAETARQTYRSFLPLNLRRKLAPLARSIRRRFANHEYERRRFFAIPHNDNAGAVRINVKGREKHGIVTRGAEYDAVVREIDEAVRTFKNAGTGAPLVKRVVCMPYEHDGPFIDVLPDVFIEWNREGATRNVTKIISEKYGEIDIEDVDRTGDHNPSGFYWTPITYEGPPVTLPEQVTAPIVQAVKGAGA